MSRVTGLTFDQLTVKEPESLHNFEGQINKLSTEISHINFTENEQARKQFFDLIMEFKQGNSHVFSHDTWKKVGHDLTHFMKYKENQIAQAILEHFRHEINSRDPVEYNEKAFTRAGPEKRKDVRYNCQKCGNSWKTLDYLEEFQSQGLINEGEEWERLQETVLLNYFRTRNYPNDFSPIPQNCPICNDGLSVNQVNLSGDLEAVKIEKDGEASDYEMRLSEIAPHGYKEVDRK